MNPKVRVVFYGEVDLSNTGEERTVVRFTLTGDEITNINSREKSLVAATRSTDKRNDPGGAQDVGTGQVVR